MPEKTCSLPEKKPDTWKTKVLWFLRILLFSSAILNIFLLGQPLFGSIVLVALAILYAPGLFTRNRICLFPLEIEILLLIVVFFELIIGDAASAYSRVTLYDKFMHTLVGFIIGLIGMILIYTAYAYGHLKASLPVMFLIILFITLGLGAMLEMVEYFYDQILYPFIGTYLPTGLTQGSPLSPPLEDTMLDLFFDSIGGIVGAALGVWIIRRDEKKGDTHLIDEIAQLEGIKKEG